MSLLHPATWTDAQIIAAGVFTLLGWAAGVALMCVLFWPRLRAPRLDCQTCIYVLEVRKQARELRAAWTQLSARPSCGCAGGCRQAGKDVA